MKNLILENEYKLDMQITSLLEYHFKDNREIWVDFKDAFWPENREKTLERLLSLNSGDNIICQTVFDGMQQTELMVEVLHKLKELNIKINFYVICNIMIEDLTDYVTAHPYYDDEEEAERQEILRKMKEVLVFHNIFNITGSIFSSVERLKEKTIKLDPYSIGFK